MLGENIVVTTTSQENHQDRNAVDSHWSHKLTYTLNSVTGSDHVKYRIRASPLHYHMTSQLLKHAKWSYKSKKGGGHVFFFLFNNQGFWVCI